MTCHAHLASQTQTRKSTQIMITEIDTLTSTMQLNTCSILNKTNFLFTNFPTCFELSLLKDSCKTMIHALHVSYWNMIWSYFAIEFFLITGQFIICWQGFYCLLNRHRIFVVAIFALYPNYIAHYAVAMLVHSI